MSSAKVGVLQLAPQAGEQAQCYIDLARLLVTGTRSFYNNPTFSDITLVCPDGRQLRCHQVILAASSKRLAAVLKQGDFTGSRLPVQGVDSDALDALIDAFYTGECPLTLASAAAIYDAATKLEVNGLPTAIEQFVSNSLTPSNACLLLNRAMVTKTVRLAEVCLQFIRNRLADVVPTLEFSTSSLEVVAQICADVANNRHPPQLALQVAIAWLRGTPNGPSRTPLLPALADQIGVSPELLATYMRNNGNSPTSGGAGGGGGNGGGGGVGSLLGDPTGGGSGLDGPLQLSSLPLLQLLPAGQLQQLGGSAAAAQLLLSQGKAGSAAALRSLLEDEAGGGGNGGSGKGGGGLGVGPGGGLDGGDLNSNATLAQRLGNLAGLRRELEEGGGGLAGALAAAAAATNRGGGVGGGKRQRTEDARQLSGWDSDNVPNLGRGLSGEQDMLAAAAAVAVAATGGAAGNSYSGSGGASGAGLGLAPQAPTPQQYSDPPPPQRDRRTPQVKGVCHVEGCYADLTGLRDYHLRYKICEFHLKIGSVLKDGVPQRFCQQCGRFHHLTEFDGNRRSCRTMLARHNMRRAKKMGQGGSPMADDGAVAPAPAATPAPGGGPDLSHVKLMQQLGPASLAAAMVSLQQQQQQQFQQGGPQGGPGGSQLQQQGGPGGASQVSQAQAQLQQLANLGVADGLSLSDAVVAAMAAALPGLQQPGNGGGPGGNLLGSPASRRLSDLIDGIGRGGSGGGAGNAGAGGVGGGSGGGGSAGRGLLEALGNGGGGTMEGSGGRGDKRGGEDEGRSADGGRGDDEGEEGGGAAGAGGGSGGATDAASLAAAQNEAMAALAAIVAAADGQMPSGGGAAGGAKEAPRRRGSVGGATGEARGDGRENGLRNGEEQGDMAARSPGPGPASQLQNQQNQHNQQQQAGGAGDAERS